MKTIVLMTVTALLLSISVAAYAMDAAHGKEVFAAQKCSMCHAIAGVGNKAHALDGVGGKLSADEIKKWIKTPKEMKATAAMKAYPTISDKDLQDLTDYLLTLK
jgi:mono/diheme cytochrome c family protein